VGEERQPAAPLVPVTVLQVLESQAVQKRLLAYSGMPDARASSLLQQQRQKLLQSFSQRVRKQKKATEDGGPMVSLYTAQKVKSTPSERQSLRFGDDMDMVKTHSGMFMNMALTPRRHDSISGRADLHPTLQLTRRPSKAPDEQISEAGSPKSALKVRERLDSEPGSPKSVLKVPQTEPIVVPQLQMSEAVQRQQRPGAEVMPASSLSAGESSQDYEDDTFEKAVQTPESTQGESTGSTPPPPPQQQPQEAKADAPTTQSTIKKIDTGVERHVSQEEYEDSFEQEHEDDRESNESIDCTAVSGASPLKGSPGSAGDQPQQAAAAGAAGGYNEVAQVASDSEDDSYDTDSDQFEQESQGTSPAQRSLESCGSID